MRKLRFLMIGLDHDYVLDIAQNMKQHGGSFVQALGECLIRADNENIRKLFLAFPNYFFEYRPQAWETKGGETL